MDRNEDIREMIRTEIQSISVLEERIAFKEMMEGVFLNLYEKNEEMYRALEMILIHDARLPSHSPCDECASRPQQRKASPRRQGMSE